MKLEDAIERAVGRAIQTVEDHSPGDPGGQPRVVQELAELEFRKLVDDDDWEWEEVETLIKREVERRV